MKVEDNKIIEITEDELYSLYLSREMDDIMSFPDYIYRMETSGTKVIK